MVQAMIQISKQANQILNIVKAQHNFKDKSEAIEYVALEYGEEILAPKLKPSYKTKLAKIVKGKHLSRKDFEKKVK